MDNIDKFKRELEDSTKNVIWKEMVMKKKGKFCKKCGNSKEIGVERIAPVEKIVEIEEINDWSDIRRNSLLWNTQNGRVVCKKCRR